MDVRDSFRDLPIMDAFNSPTRINQTVLNDLTIEYGSFKEVPPRPLRDLPPRHRSRRL